MGRLKTVNEDQWTLARDWTEVTVDEVDAARVAFLGEHPLVDPADIRMDVAHGVARCSVRFWIRRAGC